MPLISVLMGTYNEPVRKHTALAVDSILNQTFRDFEFIICDDGSDPEFFQWLRAFCAKDARIRLFKNRENRGLSYTLNRCLKKARGKYVARMDADDISLPRRFEKQAEFLENSSRYVLAGCSAWMIGQDLVWGKRRVPQRPDKKAFLNTSPFIHPSIMIRRTVMEELHGYAQGREFLRVEDYDFFMRLYAAGYEGYNLREPLLLYREDAQSFQKRKYRYRINECRVRYAGYRRLGILKGNMRYMLKPLAAGLVPGKIMQAYRKMKFKTGTF